MKKDCVYKIIIDVAVDSSDVCGAEYSCPSGRGPYVSCKNVAASLFAIEDFYSTYKEIQASSNDDVLCTSKRRLGTSLENDVYIQNVPVK